MSDNDDMGRMLAQMLATYHAEQLHGPDQDLREAIIVKTVALLALAFDIPPTANETDVDIDDTIDRLRDALYTIDRSRTNADPSDRRN
jgi:hypothetical protein